MDTLIGVIFDKLNQCLFKLFGGIIILQQYHDTNRTMTIINHYVHCLCGQMIF